MVVIHGSRATSRKIGYVFDSCVHHPTGAAMSLIAANRHLTVYFVRVSSDLLVDYQIIGENCVDGHPTWLVRYPGIADTPEEAIREYSSTPATQQAPTGYDTARALVESYVRDFESKRQIQPAIGAGIFLIFLGAMAAGIAGTVWLVKGDSLRGWLAILLAVAAGIGTFWSVTTGPARKAKRLALDNLRNQVAATSITPAEVELARYVVKGNLEPAARIALGRTELPAGHPGRADSRTLDRAISDAIVTAGFGFETDANLKQADWAAVLAATILGAILSLPVAGLTPLTAPVALPLGAIIGLLAGVTFRKRAMDRRIWRPLAHALTDTDANHHQITEGYDRLVRLRLAIARRTTPEELTARLTGITGPGRTLFR